MSDIEQFSRSSCSEGRIRSRVTRRLELRFAAGKKACACAYSELASCHPSGLVAPGRAHHLRLENCMNWNSHPTKSLICTNCVPNPDHRSLCVNRVRKAPWLTAAHLWLAAVPLILPAALPAQPQAGIIEHPLPGTLNHPTGIAAGPDGAMWFTEFTANKIGRMTAGGVLSEYPVTGRVPEVITTGPDGALWFTEFDGINIGHITTAGVFTEYPILTADSHAGITRGPDGALWFTENLVNRIARITVAGGVSEYAVPTTESAPMGITAGPDGALWFTEFSSNKIGRISTAGIFTEYSVPFANSGPYGITAGPDGALWFTEYAGNQIGRITTTGVITEYPVPAAFSVPSGITVGPDGALWFTESDGNRIGRITTAEVTTELLLPAAFSGPWAIKAGPDNSLWFTEYDGNRIGQAVIPNALLTASPDTAAPFANVTFTGSGFAPNETVKLYLNSTRMNLLYTGTADGTGSLQLLGQVFAAPYGYNAVVAVGQNSGALGFTPFIMQARLILDPKTVAIGETVTGHRFGFAAGERVDVYWNKPLRFLGEVTTESHGTFAHDNSLIFTVPTNATFGSNRIRAVGQSSGAISPIPSPWSKAPECLLKEGSHEARGVLAEVHFSCEPIMLAVPRLWFGRLRWPRLVSRCT